MPIVNKKDRCFIKVSMSSFFFLFVFLINKSFSQNKVIQFVCGKQPIPNVTVIDSAKNLFLISNDNGEVQIKNNNYSLRVSHVGFNPVSIDIDSTNNSSRVSIPLSVRITEELPIVVRSDKIKVSKINVHFGNIKKNARSGLEFFVQGKFGSIIEYNLSISNLYLKNIKFEIRNQKLTNSFNSKLEIKLYQFERPFINPVPLNTLPIIIDFKDLKRINEIAIKEKIILPPNGVLISFEFYNVNTEDKKCYIFLNGIENSEKCLIIKESIFSPYWSKKVPNNCSFNPSTFKNLRLNIKIKCSNFYE